MKFSKPRGVLRRIALGTFLILLIGALLSLAVLRDSYELAPLPDGSKIVIHSLQYGNDIEIAEGGPFQALIRSLLPKEGVQLGPFNLKPPIVQTLSGLDGDAFLYLELDAVGSNEALTQLATPSIYGNYRGMFVDENGFTYPQIFQDTSRSRQGDFGGFACYSYPRSMKQLIFHIQERQNEDSSWKTLTPLRFKNPSRTVERKWQRPLETKTAQTNGWTFSVGTVKVMTKSQDLGKSLYPRTHIPFSVSPNILGPTSMQVSRLRIEDQIGLS